MTALSESIQRPRYVLPVVLVVQFCGTSLWFATNAVVGQLQAEFAWASSVSDVTSAAQFGFIVGTAALTLSGLADRFSARAVFLVSSLAGALANLGTLLTVSWWQLVLLRFTVGIALAGVYPIGMKIAAGWYREGLGKALGLLLGALVLGTAFPHLLGGLPWRTVVVVVSLLAATGGVFLYLLVPDGPHIKTSAFDPRAIKKLMAIREFRGAAFGYFGHMWELYTLWTFLPAIVAAHGKLPVSHTSFAVIAVGALGCAGGGLLTPRYGSRAVAAAMLAVSGLCCVALPWAFRLPSWAFVCYLLVWGVTVVGDSPQYSALNARAAPPGLVGTGLALVTSVGFALTIVSIQLAGLFPDLKLALALVGIGPLLGLVALGSAAPHRGQG